MLHLIALTYWSLNLEENFFDSKLGTQTIEMFVLLKKFEWNNNLIQKWANFSLTQMNFPTVNQVSLVRECSEMKFQLKIKFRSKVKFQPKKKFQSTNEVSAQNEILLQRGWHLIVKLSGLHGNLGHSLCLEFPKAICSENVFFFSRSYISV